MIGTTLAGRYRLEQRLGAGGMGEVWRAADDLLGRPVAVKLLSSGPDQEQREARFHREARAAARLSDPGVVAVHDFGVADVGGQRVCFLVMALVDGPSLEARAAAGPLDVVQVLGWGEQICRALQAAHRAGVVHRDLKPANVLLEGDEVRLADFGIARLLEEAESGIGLTGTGAVVGTPAYMSPEQARGERSLDARSDLYSLGCLLYRLLTGAPPFTGSSWEVLVQHVDRRPSPVRSVRPEVPQAVDDLVLELLHKDPAQRPRSAEEVGRRLVRLLGAAERTAAPQPLAPPTLIEPGTVKTAAAVPRPVRRGRPRHCGRTAVWGGSLAGSLFGAQLAWAGLGTVWSVLLGAAAAVAIAAVFTAGALETAGRGASTGGVTVGSTMLAMGVAALVVLALLVWSPLPWWALWAASIATSPVLLACAAPVRALVRTAFRHGDWEVDLAVGAGLVNAVLAAVLLTRTGSAPLVGALTAGTGVWAGTALGVGLLLPRPR